LASDGHRAGGRRPGRSVLYEWGRSRDVENLFIVDGSIFVTAARVNPTRTIQALALYVANASSSGWPSYSIEVDAGCVTRGYLHASLEHLRGWWEKATVCIPPAVGLG
jgi:hypothetical protein